MNTQAELTDWLRDVYAMEKALETALEKLTIHPHCHAALREKAAQHCTETQSHADAIAAWLRHLGSDTSSLKTVLAQGLGMDLMRNAGPTLAHDERFKDVLALLVTAHYAIVCHTLLRTGAAQLGLPDLIRDCDQILLEKKRLEEWLQMNSPQIFAACLAPAAEPREHLDAAANDFVLAGNGRAPDLVHWEFVQLAQNVSLFGGPLPRHAWTGMQG